MLLSLPCCDAHADIIPPPVCGSLALQLNPAVTSPHVSLEVNMNIYYFLNILTLEKKLIKRKSPKYPETSLEQKTVLSQGPVENKAVQHPGTSSMENFAKPRAR